MRDLIEARGERGKRFAPAKDESFLDVAVSYARDFPVDLPSSDVREKGAITRSDGSPGRGRYQGQRMLTIAGGGTNCIVNALLVPATGARLITLAGTAPANVCAQSCRTCGM